MPDTGTGFRPQAIQRGDLVLATDECRTLWPWPPSARLVARLAICLTGQRLLAQDREMEPGGLGRGVDPQLVAEPGRQFVVPRERRCGSPHPPARASGCARLARRTGRQPLRQLAPPAASAGSVVVTPSASSGEYSVAVRRPARRIRSTQSASSHVR